MRRQRFDIVLSFLLLLACLSQGIGAWALPESAERLRELEASKAAVAARLQSSEESLLSFENEQALLNSDIAWLSERDAVQRDIYEKNLKTLNGLYRIRMSLETDLLEAEGRFQEKQQAYGKRIQAMFRLRERSPGEILLASKSLDAYVTTLQLMKLVTDSDERALAELKEAKEALAFRQEETLENLQELEAIRQTLEADLEAIKKDIHYVQSQSETLDQAIQEKMDLIASFYDKGRAYHGQMGAQGGQVSAQAYGSGGVYMGWPCFAHSGISSYFGWRSVPSLGLNDFHTGIDFAANYNTPVYATAPGTVIFVGEIPYGGRTVKVDIGHGLVVMYCHLNSYAVSQGMAVYAGQELAYVGSTGLSTGPHLHFEVQKYGTPVDPLQYLK